MRKDGDGMQTQEHAPDLLAALERLEARVERGEKAEAALHATAAMVAFRTATGIDLSGQCRETAAILQAVRASMGELRAAGCLDSFLETDGARQMAGKYGELCRGWDQILGTVEAKLPVLQQEGA
jgi:hypothetical protein